METLSFRNRIAFLLALFGLFIVIYHLFIFALSFFIGFILSYRLFAVVWLVVFLILVLFFNCNAFISTFKKQATVYKSVKSPHSLSSLSLLAFSLFEDTFKCHCCHVVICASFWSFNLFAPCKDTFPSLYNHAACLFALASFFLAVSLQ